MLADAVEAAARTLPEHSQERLLVMIQKIIAATTEDGQFTECDITLSDIEQITFSFLETLSSLYHSRIAYPSFDFSLGSETQAARKH
jgi:membrane-associated HD superfamily phosphohydrolase